MGKIRCSYHVASGIVNVCRHISAEIQSRSITEQVIALRFAREEYLVFYYCPICASEFKLPDHDQEFPYGKFEQIYNNERFVPACSDCFHELKNHSS